MRNFALRSFLVAAVVICDCITWTASRHHFSHDAPGHRSRHRRQGAKLFLPASYVVPGGEGYGAWGPWGEPTPCSRSCGGGVASQQRICLEITQDGRRRCEGGDRKYFSCNTQDCPEGSKDFRSEQCAEYDPVPIKNTTYNWVPYTKAPNPCELNCMPRGERFYYRHRSKVTDGTLCNSESLDVCVDGACQPVGCDMMLGSQAQEDNCRECRGNGSSCRTISEVNRDQGLRSGYNDILLIPAGSTNIDIQEIEPSNNYLAVRSALDGRYHLNGDFQIDFPRHLQFAGALWIYERTPQGFPAPDKLRCQGPTVEPVYLSLLLLDVNVGVRYEYSVPTGMVRPPDEQYVWVHEAFTPCSATCGGGTQSRNVTCRSRQELTTVDDSLCDAQLRPPSEQACAGVACAARWTEGPWGPCSQPCGGGGSQSRQVHCEKVISNGLPSLVADDECFSLLGPKPDLHRRCNEGGNCPKWHTGPWQPCDKLCGEGKQKRKVTCFLRSDGRVEVLPDGECSEEKPPAQQQCMLHPCEGVDWITSDWSGCDTCLSTVRTRTAHCATKHGQVMNSSFCAHHAPPALREPCDPADLPECQFQWFASQWSECTPQCGAGEQRRQVFCGKQSGTDLTRVKDEMCDPAARYNDTQPCTNKQEDCPAMWHAGPWTACSKLCGSDGQQDRRVLCIRGGEEPTVAKDCDIDTIPDSNQPCNQGPCDEDHILPEKPGATQPTFEDDYGDCEDEDEYPEEGVDAVDSSTPVADTDSTDELTSAFTDEGYMQSDSPSSYGSTSSDIESSGLGDLSSSTAFTESEATEGSGEDTLGTASTSLISSEDAENTKSDGSTTEIESETSELSSENSSSTKSEESSESESTNESESTTERQSTNESGVTIAATTVLDISKDNNTDDDYADGTKVEIFNSDYDTPQAPDYTKSTSNATTKDSTTKTSSEPTETTEYLITESSLGTSSDVTSESSTTDSSTIELSTTDSSTTDSSTNDSSTTDSSTTDSSTTDSSRTDSSTTDSSTTDSSTTDSSTTDSSTIDSSTTDSSRKDLSTTDLSSTDSSTTDSSTTDLSTPSSEEDSSISFTTIEVSGSSTDETEETTASTESSRSTEETESVTGSSSETLKSSTTDALSSGTDSTIKSEASSEPDATTESEGTTESGSTTDLSASTEFSATSESDVTTESGATTESEGTSKSDDTTLSGETTESGATTESGSTTEEGSSTEGSTTVSGVSTEESSESGSTESYDTSSWSWASTVEEYTKRPKCRKRLRKSKCASSLFGCCADNKTEAAGPFEEGCFPAETCKDTIQGCCPDGLSPAEGPKGLGCPSSHCNETLFGCCASDKETPAQGNDQEGCPPPPPPCTKAKFGCCKDNRTEAKGPKGKGCPENAPKPKTCHEAPHGCCYDNSTQASGPDQQGCPCAATQHGCCPDQVSPAQGPQMQGCVMSCNSSAYGCCPDNETPAHGLLGEGCCLATSFGCCPDNVNIAQGPHFEGCGCQWSPYGCCPDNVTVARGHNNEGCGCKHTPHGCCPNRYTPALGPNFEGCQCFTYQFGCCPDGKTVAKGPQQLGCRCSDTEFGCCGDGQTPAQGSNNTGCDCASSKFGCCPDGLTEAMGEKFLGCTDKPESLQASCGLAKERGPCRNYTVRWYYDTEYGGCSRFWYGGCEGNGNRFASQEECRDVCVEPPGKDACKLPKIKGICEGYHPRWYYDTEREVCGQFVYGGCLGNANKFETREECQGRCEEPRNKDQCELPVEAGSCAGNFVRWAFDADSKRCSQFVWGGCEGNGNRFPSESACIQKCDTPGTLKDECRLPREAGNCTEKVPKWFFDQGENRCMPFYYTGCNGNDNQFDSERECESRCPQVVVQDLCTLPSLTGDCADYRERWYFDSAEQGCRRFFYGGCNGNGNNFPTEDECQRRCVDAPTTTPAPAPLEPFRADFCFLGADRGPCSNLQTRYYYEPRTGACRQFLYGGCGGNQNNFPTQEHCTSYCAAVQDICQLPMLVGPCDDSQTQWYYEARSDSCSQFAYSGCEGNGNRFNSREECERRCKSPVIITTTQNPQPQIDARGPELEEECRQPPSLAPCGPEQEAWYYDDRRGSCAKTTTGGCRRLNNYNSEEACERRCGVFKAVEVCRYPVDPGSCRGSVPKIYFDAESGHCLDFMYGGCGGGPNRFSSVEECREVCGGRQPDVEPEPPTACRQPVMTGWCPPGEVRSAPSRRWYYSLVEGACQVFVYEGCGGNLNNFRSHAECERACDSDHFDNEIPEPCDTYRAECDRLSCDFGVERRKTEGSCEQCVCAHPCTSLRCAAGEECSVEYTTEGKAQPVCLPVENEVTESCDKYRAECDSLSCDFGVERRKTADNCEQCACAHPCTTLQCGGGDRCTVTYAADGKLQPVCRPTNKPGTCPSYPEEAANERCSRECNDDADCQDGDKCCQRGCHLVCAPPQPAPTAPWPYTTQRPYTNPPATPAHPRAEQQAPPAIAPETPSEVASEEGGLATLRCMFSGYPAPIITWQRGELTIDGTAGRYRILTDGALQIVSVYRNDSGVYVCIGNNGIGEPARKEVTLDVRDPARGPAGVVGDDNASVTGTLYRPLLLRCAAYGYPAPDVWWWKGDSMLPFASQYYEIDRDGLLIRSLEPETLGVYTCQAFNGVGKPASWSVTVRAYRPDDGSVASPWLVARAQGSPATRPPTTPAEDIDPYIVPDVYEPPEYKVAVQTAIPAERTTFPAGAELSLPCEVEGHPLPTVTWSKDGQPLETSGRLYISEGNRLTVLGVQTNDSGVYSCHASNAYSSHSSYVQINVEGLYVHPNCTDNPFFANCQLIVKAKYCRHEYYAKFCCRSCTLAGQLSPQDMLSDQPRFLAWRRK